MKHNIFLFVGIIALLIGIRASSEIDHTLIKVRYPQKATAIVDLPEEWVSISLDASRPDTMIAYRRGDSVFLGFKN